MFNRDEENISRKLRAIKEGAMSTGVGGLLGFFSSSTINNALSGGSVGLTVTAFKNTFKGDGEAMLYNSIGGLSTNLLGVLLYNFGPDLSGPLALIAAAALISVTTECIAVLIKEGHFELRNF